MNATTDRVRIRKAPADPRPRVHRLDQDGTRDDVSEGQGDQGRRGQHRVAKRMPDHDGSLRQALGACRQDVVLTQRLEHGGADDQRVLAVERECQREGRKRHVDEHVLDVLPPRRVEQEVVRHAVARQVRGQVHEQNQGQPLRGERIEGDGGVGADLIERGSPAPGGDHAGHDPEEDREHGPQSDHRDRVRQRGLQVGHHGLLVGDEPLFDHSSHVGFDLIHQLHGLDDAQYLPRLDGVADLDERRRARRGGFVKGADNGRLYDV